MNLDTAHYDRCVEALKQALDLVGRTADLSPMPLDCYCDLKEKIQDSTIPILVEFRDWARIPESFQKNILRKHEVLCGGQG